MINDSSVIQETSLTSPLQSSSTIRPKKGSRSRLIVAGLMLTSLVDAFSILVVYLLINLSNTGEMLYLDKETELPVASETVLLERNTIVKVKDSKIFIEEQEVSQAALVKKLLDIRKNWAQVDNESEEKEPGVTIQADRRVEYRILNDIILASNHAGFSDIHFAVLQK